MHESCIAHLNEEAGIQHEEAKTTGSVLTGTVGALLGGIIGSIPWAIAYYFGWFVGWLGFLIGIAAKKGYELLKGKETRVKSVILVVVTIISVILVEFVAGIISWNIEFANDPELASYGLSFSQIASLFIEASIYDAEMRGALIGNFILSLIFAGLGIYSTVFDVFKKTGKNSGSAIRLD